MTVILMHQIIDFRRSAAYEMRKAGVPDEEAMKVTGHLTNSMYNRYADLFCYENGVPLNCVDALRPLVVVG